MTELSQAPQGYVIEIKPENRSLDQNAKLWAMLTDVSDQIEYHGNKLSKEAWKSLFTGSMTGMEIVPSIDGRGFVMLGKSTSKMNRREFSELIELIYWFGADRDVKWSDPALAAFDEYFKG